MTGRLQTFAQTIGTTLAYGHVSPIVSKSHPEKSLFLSSFQFPLNGEQHVLFHLLLKLRFQLADEVIALCFNFILSSKQLATQLTALAFQFALLLLPCQLFVQRR